MNIKKKIIDKIKAADEKKYSRYLEYLYALVCELFND